MAVTAINKTYAVLNEGTTVTEVETTGEFSVDLTGADYKTAIAFRNAGTDAITVTINIGDGIQGVGEDITFTVAKASTAYVVVDSGAYKNVSGESKGLLLGTTSGTLSISAVELP